MSHVDTVYGFKWLRTNVLHVHSRHKETAAEASAACMMNSFLSLKLNLNIQRFSSIYHI